MDFGKAIDAAKYENDIKRNQKKLDRAYEKGNNKEIAKNRRWLLYLS